MTIASEITKLNTNLTNSYTACQNKGATLPASQNFDNLASTISAIPAATEPMLASLTVTPSTTAQTLTPPSGTDGYNTVTVSAVTASIDSDIVAENIKSGVNILGVAGTVTALAGETRTVSITSTSGNTFTPSNGKNGITSIKCNPTNKALTITPSKTSQTKTVPSSYSGYGTVKCNAVTSSIDSNITAGNIKSGVTILGVTGTYEGSGGGGIGITREVSAQGVYQMPATSFTFSLPSNATDLGQYTMYHAFYNCTGLTSVDLSSLTTVSGNNGMSHAFYNCTGLTSVDLSSLTTVSGNSGMNHALSGCTGLTSVDLSSLTTVRGTSAMYYAFSGCTGLTSVDLSSLTTVSGTSAMSYALSGCTGLTSVDLSSLTTVSGTQAMQYAFNGCTGLTSVDLSSLTTMSDISVMTSAFQDCTGLTSVDLSSLTTVSGRQAMSSTFRGCTGVTSILFTNLETIGTNTSSVNYGHFSNCFNNCNKLTSITFPKLEKIYCTGGTTTSYGTFAGNDKVQKMYFPKLDTITYGSGTSSSNRNACKNIFYGCSALTELHFAAANQTAIEASPGYSTAWGRGAGNVTIYFDL